MSEETRGPINLNRAEVEGLRHVIAERDRHLQEANGLDQYLRQIIAEVIRHRGEAPEAGWSLNLPDGKIVPVQVPEVPTIPEPVDVEVKVEPEPASDEKGT